MDTEGFMMFQFLLSITELSFTQSAEGKLVHRKCYVLGLGLNRARQLKCLHTDLQQMTDLVDSLWGGPQL